MEAEAGETLISQSFSSSFGRRLSGTLSLRILVLEVSFGNRKKEGSHEDNRDQEEATSVVQGEDERA